MQTSAVISGIIVIPTIIMEGKQMLFKTRIPSEWAVVAGNLGEVGQTAARRAFYLIQKCVDYRVDILTEEEYAASGNDGNALILRVDETAVPQSEGYIINVTAPDEKGYQKIEITAHDEPGLLWGIDDLDHYYICHLRYRGRIADGYFGVFREVMPEFRRESCPKIEYRGFWTWGYVIYDYRGYIDYMSRWKLNTLIIWNDFVPVNIKEVISYAHSRGVKVILGYSCGWDTSINLDPGDSRVTAKWHEDVMNLYRGQYKDLGMDGVYFQAFTETSNTEIGGKSIAKLVADWINYIGGDMLAEFPGIEIFFGLHATSIKDRYKELDSVDSRIHLVWEDCGSYPYEYIPDNTNGFEDTLKYTGELADLRGENERFGVVFKGFTLLNWGKFRHHARVAIGEADEDMIEALLPDRRYKWVHYNASCLESTDLLKATIQRIASSKAKTKLVTILTEDGLIERIHPQCAAVAAELMWEPDMEVKKVLRVTSETGERI